MNKAQAAWLAVLITVIGGTVGAVDYFAKSKDLESLAMDFQQERLYNRMDRLEERMWTIRNGYPQDTPIHQWKPCDQEEYRKLEQELRRTQEGFRAK